jgi:hypothetical protein
MFAAFRKTLLHHSDEQIVSIISNWMNRLIGDGFELLGPDEDGGPTEDKLDDFCELLGFRLVSNATGQTYASCSAWRDIEADQEDCCAEFKLDDLTGFRSRMKALTFKQIDAIVDLAHWCKTVEAEDECRPGPSLYPQFLIELTEEISQ